MKWFVFSIVLAFTTTAKAQFIPQPMGYNPDENSDGLIGVGDLQGLLALYGSSFNNHDSIVVASIEFGPQHFYDPFCLCQTGGGYECEERACDNFPIQPLALPVADVYNIHIPSMSSADADWWPEGIYNGGCGSFIATMPEVDGFKAVIVYFTSDEFVEPDRRARVYDGADFAQIDFSECSAYVDTEMSDSWLISNSAQYLDAGFTILIHTADGSWRRMLQN